MMQRKASVIKIEGHNTVTNSSFTAYLSKGNTVVDAPNIKTIEDLVNIQTFPSYADAKKYIMDNKSIFEDKLSPDIPVNLSFYVYEMIIECHEEQEVLDVYKKPVLSIGYEEHPEDDEPDEMEEMNNRLDKLIKMIDDYKFE